MRPVFILFFAMFTLPVFSEPAGGVSAEEARALSGELGGAFRDLGAFQVKYRAARPGQHSTLTLSHNPTKRFALLTLERGFPELSTMVQLILLGVVGAKEDMGVSWFSPERIQQAERVTQTPETVTLVFPGGRHVRLQRATGLLAREHWPDNLAEFPETITLVEHKPLEESTGVADLLPALATAEIREGPNNQLVGAIFLSFFTQLNQMFAERCRRHSENGMKLPF